MTFDMSDKNIKKLILNGTDWFDTDGRQISAHAGGMSRFGDTYTLASQRLKRWRNYRNLHDRWCAFVILRESKKIGGGSGIIAGISWR